MHLGFATTILLSLGVVAALDLAAARGDSTPVNFERDVEPILRQRCVQCHGPDEQQGQLRLDHKTTAFRGGFSGPAIVAGDPQASLILQLVNSTDAAMRMPMDQPPLSAEEIATLRSWIEQGADWPESSRGGEPKTHWAYTYPAPQEPPDAKNLAWIRNSIDAFVLARLEQEDLAPSAEAERATLLRRLSFDLIGLPPTLEELDAFLADDRRDAYEHAVDRLLASPHYGERWATAWLDAARYADSNGYTNDRPRSMWLYRDWVIDALNADMPFDQFTVEQIAGDLLPSATVDQRIATGFFRNSMFNDEMGVDQQEARWNALVERTGTTGTVWLGSTLACAQCHNHKYDPFSQKDFYALLAFFENTAYTIEGKDHNSRLAEPTLDMADSEERQQRESLEKQIAEEKAKPQPVTDGVAEVGSASMNPESRKVDELERELKELTKSQPVAMILEERSPPGEAATPLRIRGSFLTRGELVAAAAPSCLPPLPAGTPPNRLTLARWLVDDENPLVARVIVNRAWSQFFGRGIVETEEDFGARGTPPSHPELLDWLAAEFRGSGWSMKQLHKLIVMSATYRQSSHITPTLRERDSENTLLARGPRHRLNAEFIRDATLAASGLLSRQIGGPSVFPPQPQISPVVDHGDVTWETSQGADRYRRGIYTFWRRSALYPALANFDAPTRETCTVKRTRSNTPLQALSLLNDATAAEAAAALAERIQQEGGADIAAQAAYGFRLCTGRHPSPAERQALVNFHRSYAAEKTPVAADSPNHAWLLVSQALLNLDETITKE